MARILSRLATPTIFFFQAEDGIRDIGVTGVQTCALPILEPGPRRPECAPREKRMMEFFAVLLVVMLLVVAVTVTTAVLAVRRVRRSRLVVTGDRKSTRLNSSHANISYAVFCLKKKTQMKQ